MRFFFLLAVESSINLFLLSEDLLSALREDGVLPVDVCRLSQVIKALYHVF